MAKKDKKSKTAEQKARVAAKQSKKAAQKEKKIKSKSADDSNGDDVDLESVLEAYAKQVCFYSIQLFGGHVPYCDIVQVSESIEIFSSTLLVCSATKREDTRRSPSNEDVNITYSNCLSTK